MKTPIYAITGVLALLLLASCTSPVNVDYNQSTDFKSLKTFEIDPVPDTGTRDSRLNSPLFSDRIYRVINYMLDSKGFVFDAEHPDFRVVFRIDKAQELQSDNSGFTVGVGSSFGRHVGTGFAFNVPTNDVRTIDRGVLTIDIISTQTGELIWRGSSSRRIFNGNTPESADTLVFEIVTEILEKFPPGKKPAKPVPVSTAY